MKPMNDEKRDLEDKTASVRRRWLQWRRSRRRLTLRLPASLGTDLQPDRAAGVSQPARRRSGVLLGLWLQRHRRRALRRQRCPTPVCPTMQVPGPTLIVTEGQTVTVTLTNNLPAAGRQHVDPVSRLPGDDHAAALPGLLTQEAAPGER